MLQAIENAIKTRLNEAGFTHVYHLDENPLIDKSDMALPIGRIVTQSGSFERITSDKLRCMVRIIVILDFMHEINSDTRDRGLYALLTGIIGVLWNKTLGLPISPIRPIRFERDFEAAKIRGSIATYALVMETRYVIAEMSDETAVDLLRVGLEYYLQDPEDDHRVDASDLLDLEAHPWIRFPMISMDRITVYVPDFDIDIPFESLKVC